MIIRMLPPLAQRANVSVDVGESPRDRCSPNMRHVVVPCVIAKNKRNSTTTWRKPEEYAAPWAFAHVYGHIAPLGQRKTWLYTINK